MTNHYHYRSITQFLWVLHPKKDRLGVFSLTEWLVIQVGFLVYFLKRVSRGSCSFQKGILALTNIYHQHLDLSGLYFHPLFYKICENLGGLFFSLCFNNCWYSEPWALGSTSERITYPLWIAGTLLNMIFSFSFSVGYVIALRLFLNHGCL